MFSTLSKTEIIIFVTFNLSSANASNLVWSKILGYGNGLKYALWRTKGLNAHREGPGMVIVSSCCHFQALSNPKAESLYSFTKQQKFRLVQIQSVRR